MIRADLLVPVDACPVCDPGVPGPALALAAEDVPGGMLASFECPSCGTGWQTLFDALGWPRERTSAPVTGKAAA